MLENSKKGLSVSRMAHLKDRTCSNRITRVMPLHLTLVLRLWIPVHTQSGTNPPACRGRVSRSGYCRFGAFAGEAGYQIGPGEFAPNGATAFYHVPLAPATLMWRIRRHGCSDASRCALGSEPSWTPASLNTCSSSIRIVAGVETMRDAIVIQAGSQIRTQW